MRIRSHRSVLAGSHRSALGASLLALCLFAAACSSTNKDSGAGQGSDSPTEVEAGEAAPGEVTGGDATVPGGDPAAPGAPAGSAGAAGSPTGGGTAAKPGGSTGGGSGGGAARMSPGVTNSEMLIGTIYANNGGAANAAFGYAGIGQIDYKRMWEAVIAEVNGKGGVAGRKLKPVWYVVEGTDFQTTTDTHNQRACATWSEDNRVFVAFSAGDVLNACLAKKGIPQIVSTGGGDTAEFQKYPRLFSVAGVASDRMARFVVDRLAARNYYKGAKLGVVVYQTPTYERAGKVMLDELSRRGVKPTGVAYIKQRANTQGASDEIAAIRSAVLKFKTDGVTHVQFMSDNSAWVQLNFMKAAQDQQFFPRYGLSSNDGGQTMATLLGPDAASQLKGSIGVGWFPIFDVPVSESPDSAALARCKKIGRDAGQEFSDPTRNTEAQAAGVCDDLFFLKQAVELGTPDITNDSFRMGAERVKNFGVANTFRSSMSPTRHDGVGAIRNTEWFDACECFKYVTPEQAI